MSGTEQPALFVSHGSPLAALAEDAYARDLRAFAAATPRPRAVLMISAHWQTGGAVAVGAAAKPATIHDFGGFPDELFRIRYGAPGAPALAREAATQLDEAGVTARLDETRGLDHGAWVPLRLLYPEADVPVVPVSLPVPRTPELLGRLGAALAPLRRRGVIIIGSGSLVHNFGEMAMRMEDGDAAAWAREFDHAVADAAARGDTDSLARWRAHLPHADRAAPTDEHFDPLLAVIGARLPGDRAVTVHTGFHHANLSMRCIAFTTADVPVHAG
jgi:4,5-DOPA dioxygenase extradiol